MKILFSGESWPEYCYFQKHEPKLSERIQLLIEECRRHPFKGIGKPEPLRGQLKGWWSRRINREHRLIYRVRSEGEAQMLEIAQCRYHY